MSAVLKTSVAQRAIVLRTRGFRHGPITRLVSPSDIGELIKPFVFLDLFDISAAAHLTSAGIRIPESPRSRFFMKARSSIKRPPA